MGIDVFSGWGDISLTMFQNIKQYIEFESSEIVMRRKLVESLIGRENAKNKSWSFIGYCDVCKKETQLSINWLYSYGGVPNFRESLTCEECKLNNRQRFMYKVIDSIVNTKIGQKLNIYCYEEITPFFKKLGQKFHGEIKVIGSEYLGIEIPSGKIVNGIRHEDALNLSFEDESIDIIVSNDVYEHVPDVVMAIKEAYRVIRKQGFLVFTVPFHSLNENTIQRAQINTDRSINNNLPAIYHGNPVSEKGSLVFYDFGWDLLDNIRQGGFSDVQVLGYYSYLHGYLGNGLQLLFIAEK